MEAIALKALGVMSTVILAVVGYLFRETARTNGRMADALIACASAQQRLADKVDELVRRGCANMGGKP